MPVKEIIIVGAGSAGCMLASQLAARNGVRVTLVEPPAGKAPEADRRRPSQWLNLLGSDEDWDFSTTASPSLAGRSLHWPRGKGLGGSSRINAMIWFPPTTDDLRAMATQFDTTVEALRQSLAAVEGLVQPETPTWVSAASQNFLAAIASSGASSDGQPKLYQRVNRNGRRWNPARLLSTVNVRIVRKQVDTVTFDSDRATGVCLTSGETINGDAIILSAGAIATPTILMRSGIGPADVLTEAGVDIRQDEPTVGANLQDHLIMPVIFGVDPQHRFDLATADVSAWETDGNSPLASNLAESGGLFAANTDSGKAGEAIQVHVTPTHYLTYPDPKSPAAMTIGVNVTQPKSRGTIKIESADPSAPPVIQPNYLSEPSDLSETVRAVQLARTFVQQEPLASFITGEILPGSKRESDESIAKSITRYAQTLYHPVGTCAGLKLPENLQIVDASALQQLTMGNPNAAVMMLAHSHLNDLQK